MDQIFESLLDSVASNDLWALYINFKKHQHSFERKYQSHPVAGADLNLKTHLHKAFNNLQQLNVNTPKSVSSWFQMIHH